MPLPPLKPDAGGPESGMPPQTVRITVEGMTCAVCVQTIERSVGAEPGVAAVRVSLITSLALIHLEPGASLTPEGCVELIEDMGFDGTLQPRLEPNEADITLAFSLGPATSPTGPPQPPAPDDLAVGGGPAMAVAAALDALVGVISSDIVGTPTGGRVALCYDRTLCGPRDLVKALQHAGAANVEVASEATAGEDGAARERRYWERLLTLGLVFTTPAFLIAMVLPHLDDSLKRGLATEIAPRLSLKHFLLFLLATPVQFVLGKRFYVGAWNSMKHGIPNMDVLIAGGTTAAYLYSVTSVSYGMATPGFQSVQFFETSAMLITFVFLGKYFEAVARRKTSAALRTLLDLQPPVAIIILPGPPGDAGGDGSVDVTEEIAVELLHVGDLVKVRGDACAFYFIF